MPIAVACRCGKKLSVRDEMAGRKGKCPACGTVLDIPSAPKAAPASPAPSPAGPATKGAVPAGASPGAAAPGAKPKGKVQPTSRVFKPDADLMREMLSSPAPASAPPKGTPAPKTKTGTAVQPGGAAGGGGKTCPTCGATVKAQEIFCVQCGSSLEQRAASTRGKRGDAAARVAGAERSPWLLRGIVAGVVGLPLLIGLVWWWISEAGKIREWQERTQGGTRVELDKDTRAGLDHLLNLESRDKLKGGRVRIDQDIEDLGSWRFERRRVGYEEIIHLIDLPSTKSEYRPDLGWWARRRELSKIEEWWAANRGTLFWNARERRFSGRSAAKEAGEETKGGGGGEAK